MINTNVKKKNQSSSPNSNEYKVSSQEEDDYQAIESNDSSYSH